MVERKKRNKLNDYVEPVNMREEETSIASRCSDTTSIAPAQCVGHAVIISVCGLMVPHHIVVM